MTPDGRYILFASTANNLTLMTNGSPMPATVPAHQNVFLRDRQSGTTVLVSVNVSGVAGGNGDSLPADLSTNGRYALFESDASDLVPGDTNNAVDIFLRDLISGVTRLVSAAPNNGVANGGSRDSVLTPDGRYAAFVSDADNLVPGDTNRIADVFIRDLQTGTTTLVSAGATATNSAPGGGSSDAPLVTPDGRYVAFSSTATNLVPNAGGVPEVYVRDVVAGRTVWASSYARAVLQSVLTTTNAVSYNYSLSADGQFVAYEASLDPRLVQLYPLNSGIILRFNVGTGLTDVVSTNANIPAGPYASKRSLDTTPDGRFVAFVENEFNNTGTNTAIAVWDAQTGLETLTGGTNTLDVPWGSTCDWPVLDPTGRLVAFFSDANGLVTNTLPGNYHLYLADLQAQTTTLLEADTNENGSMAVVPATIPRLSADGRWVAFESPDNTLVAQDRNHAFDVFVRDLVSNKTELVSVHHPSLVSLTPNGSSALTTWSTSADGRYLAFASTADDIVPGDTNECRDVFVRDLVTGTNFLVSLDQFGIASGNGVSTEPTLTLDGRYVAFTSSATNLIDGDINQCQDVFVRDLEAGTNILVSWSLDGTGPGDNHSYAPFITGDGRYVLFRSMSTNLAAGAFSGAENLYVRDLQAADTFALTTNGVGSAAMNRNGRLIAFTDTNARFSVWSLQSASVIYAQSMPAVIGNLSVNPDESNVACWILTSPPQLLEVDLSAKTNRVVDSGVPASKVGLRFSSDGRFLTYASSTPTATASQVYVYDFQTASRLLVSRNSAGTPANSTSDDPEISPDGRFIAYRSLASDIVPSGSSTVPQIFLFDRETQSTWLLSVSETGKGTPNARSLAPLFSPDGQALLFQSWASDLVPQDFNQADDLFAVTLLYVGISPTANGNPGFSLNWTWAPGKSYHVQSKANLTDAAWLEATGIITTNGAKAYFNGIGAGATQAFYRVLEY